MSFLDKVRFAAAALLTVGMAIITGLAFYCMFAKVWS